MKENHLKPKRVSIPKRAFVFFTNGHKDKDVSLRELSMYLYNSSTLVNIKQTKTQIPHIARFIEERKKGFFCRVFDIIQQQNGKERMEMIGVRLCSKTPENSDVSTRRLIEENAWKRKRAAQGFVASFERGASNVVAHELMPTDELKKIKHNDKPLLMATEEERKNREAEGERSYRTAMSELMRDTTRAVVGPIINKRIS